MMKYIIILGDGMADYPIESLGGKTPLQVANKPHIDELCAKSRCGLYQTVPLDMPPGSEIANLAVLGYNVKEVFQGRGVLEAASMGIELADNDLAMRCNIITIENDNIKNHSAGHISTEEARELINFLNKQLGNDTIKFYPGVSYRHLLIIKNGKNDFECTPPHDVPGKPFRNYLPRPLNQKSETSELLNNLIFKSQELLPDHPINIERKKKNKDIGNSIWPWSQGYKPQMKTFQELYNIKGAMISAVDLLYGIGKYAGFTPIKVEGATGLYNTNYEGKAKAAIDALKDHDLVYLHIEASDEAGHEGNVELKIKTIEYLDRRVVKYIMEETSRMTEPVSIALLPDHPTPCSVRTHTHDPVPFLIYNPFEKPDNVVKYDEFSVQNGAFGLIKDDMFIKLLLNKV